MKQRFIVVMAAWLEIVVGAIFLAMPDIPCQLLFATTPEGVCIPLVRFAGVALIALGIACLPSAVTGPRHSAVLGLLVFNVGMVGLLALVAVGTTFRGLLLWPTLILHAIIAVTLLQQFRNRNALNHSLGRQYSEPASP
jgi:hypothetical protein